MDEPELAIPGAGGDEPPADFARALRDALVHLYDPAHLLRQPLTRLLVPILPPRADPAQALRDYILDAIESLEPPERTGRAAERDQRPYLVLTHRYVDGYTSDETIAALHISARQFQREHQKGLQALAVHIWNEGRGQLAPRPPSPAAADGLRAAVDTFGVQLEAASLGELLASVDAPITALAQGYGVDYKADTGASAGRALYDRVLARQALLSCLSDLCGQRPAALRAAVITEGRAIIVEIAVTPPLPASGAGTELAACHTLLASQGAGIEMVGANGSVSAVRLCFRPETTGHVLVVDDNEEMLDLYRRYLATGKYAVSAATSAAEAEAMLGSALPDAIVLDVMMREVDGWELLQRLRARPGLRAVPIVVCSILNEPELAFALGAQAYLKKPIISDDLIAALERVLAPSSPAAPPRVAPGSR